MQFHYVVGYDTDTRKWFIDGDQSAYLPDGNVWHEERGGFWDVVNENEKLIDDRAYTMLRTLATIWPEVDHGN